MWCERNTILYGICCMYRGGTLSERMMLLKLEEEEGWMMERELQKIALKLK